MRITDPLLVIAIALIASCDRTTAVSKAATTQNGFYAELYNVEDGVVTNKMRVPLGDVKDYKKTDLKAFKEAFNQEERAAVMLPKGITSLFKGIKRFAGFFKRGKRRLRLAEA
ncbi:uncharacterized protein PITG_14065 [Phytophthora infestans T30-4]|uniref:Secreted RxLR effector peptide protein n=2 Tax=Phytophthora infestans TaxID=4787 RepID=D0NNJ9_PHYIT|nr:uncharacterized protein PITG_14065 [Phytophthora infestans T30-4]EEY62170.1 conserved hypothetical protein [Phytophthora infestans T30-4]KAF4041669.1 hypothetical protein GN244_ATG06186 [Phytophthora infestans]KAF4133685.1 hypothetical protein GN958_ATG17022 [Phytophthora infestans]KAI9991436.1 hypothetical protein PInf_019117 [Phytophthora infestans]|eukprot:XP_002899201.1 conserved hypothetical protein [Phytophthora infestans T30-4]